MPCDAVPAPWQIPFSRPGDGYLWDAETNRVKYLHVPFITDEEIHSLRRVVEAGDGRSVSESPATATATSKYRGTTTTPPVEMRDEGQR